MIKNILILMAILLASVTRQQAQVTLQANNVPFQSPHTEYRQTLKTSGLTIPKRGANQLWDYGNPSVSFRDTLYFYKPNDPQFSGADRYYIENIPFGSFNLTSDYYFLKNSSGILNVGNYSYPARVGLGGITMNSNDSLIFPGTYNVNFNQPLGYLNLPISYDSSWASKASFVTDFILTFQLAGYNQDSGYNIQHVTSYDTVTGWGRLILPLTGGGVDTYEVLMIHTTQIYVDSYYINGAPAPSQLLNGFGLKQSDTGYGYYVRFYTPNYDGNLLEFYFYDAFQTVSYASYTMISGPTTGITQLSPDANIEVYPNPVCDDILRIRAPNGRYTLQLYDINGRNIMSREIQVAGNHSSEIKLENLPSGGLYFYKVNGLNDRHQQSGKILIQ